MADPLFVKEPASESRFEIKRYGYTLVLLVSADGVECCCSYEPSTTGGTPLTGEELQNFLNQFKINTGILPEGQAALLNAAASGKPVAQLLLARGTEMLPGEDGQLVLAVSDALSRQKEEQEANESGIIDLRKVQSFLNVETGQLVATIVAPGPGQPGVTVFGKEIPPEPGKPISQVLGLNTRLDEDGRSIFAEAPGRVCVKESEISVEDLYEIDGDVDFKIGNIVFKGFVEIKGDVLDGFSVKTTGGMKVHGIIGACTIESDGNIFFSGMNGQGTGTVTCGGSVTANYIYETSVECAGDLTVDVEIRNAQIRCLGAVCVTKGGLSGGECFALGGVESAVLGNLASLYTRIVAGVHYRDQEELNVLFHELKQLIANYQSSSGGDVKEFTRQRAAISQQTQQVRSRSHERSNPKINVRKVLYEGVNITLGNMSENIKEARKGPVSVIENTIAGGLRYLGLTPLTFRAQTIEQTFVQQYQLEQKRLNS